MTTQLKILSAFIGVSLFIYIIELVRRKKLREEYAWVWLLTGLMIVVLAVWYDLLLYVSGLMGGILPSALLFFFGLLFLSIAGGEEVHYLCDRRIDSGRSNFQQIDIVDTRLHGRMLFLDGVAQSSEMDEFVYHEMLVHPALFSHPKPRSVLVIGGATGATLREFFRHPEIRRVVMVDIDGELVELCKRFLPSWHRHSFDDPRLELIIGDGREYVEKCCETFDVAILDLSDPIEGTPAPPLYTREFYQSLRRLLSRSGAFSMQGEGTSPQQATLHAKILELLLDLLAELRNV